MAITIRDVQTIATAPGGINLLAVKIQTSEPGLYGVGCSAFCCRYATVRHLIETYLKPLIIGRPVQGITDFFMEDVVSQEQVGWLREIHNYRTAPLALGELYVNDNEWRTPVAERSVDFVRAHISDIGGVTPARRMAAFAESCGDGFVYAGGRPGMGVDVSEEAAAKYPCRADIPTWTQTRNQDGSLQTS